VIHVVISDPTAHDQSAVVQPFNAASRHRKLMVEHNCVGILDAAEHILLVEGVKGLDVGQVAENTPLWLHRVVDEVGYSNLMSVAHCWLPTSHATLCHNVKAVVLLPLLPNNPGPSYCATGPSEAARRHHRPARREMYWAAVFPLLESFPPWANWPKPYKLGIAVPYCR
jgi:hypothetical protein